MAKFHTKTTENDAGKFKPPIATKPAPPTNKSKPAIAPKKTETENPYSPMYPVAAWRELTKELSSPHLKELAGGQIGSNINNSKLNVDTTKKYNGDRSPTETSARTPLFQIGRQNTFKEKNVNSTTQETGNSYTTRPLDFHHNLIMKLSQNPVGGNEIKRCPSKEHLPPKPLRLSPCNKPGVPPRKALPNPKQLGPRPPKPTRPPLVDLTRFTKGKGVMLMVQPANEKKMDFMKQKFEAKDLLSSLQHHPRIRSTGSGSLTISTSSCEDREEYDDVETVRPMPKRAALSPAPPPKPKPKMSSSSKEDDFYDDVGSLETIFPPPPPQLRKSQEFRINWKNLIKQQREVEEKEFRKKFKFEGEIKVLTRMMVDPNAVIKKCGSYDLPHKRGDFLDVIQYTSQEKYLCRNIRWKFGYVPKRSLLSIEKDVYDDVGIFEELYDDIDLINKAMPPALPKMRKPSEAELYAVKQANEKNLKKLKKEEKEEKDIRKKFKLEGEITVLTQMMVDPNAKIKKGGGKYLSHKRGEILEVVERTSLEKLLCRNSKGKYGYVPRLYLLQVSFNAGGTFTCCAALRGFSVKLALKLCIEDGKENQTDLFCISTAQRKKKSTTMLKCQTPLGLPEFTKAWSSLVVYKIFQGLPSVTHDPSQHYQVLLGKNIILGWSKDYLPQFVLNPPMNYRGHTLTDVQRQQVDPMPKRGTAAYQRKNSIFL